MKLDVLLEDNHLLVVNKPAGLASQGGEAGRTSLTDLAKNYLRETYRKPGNVFVGLVHRLDQPTSGVIALTRTSKAAARLSEQLRLGLFSKTYWAIVEGGVEADEGEWVDRLEKDRSRNQVDLLDSDDEGGKEARLSYRVIERSIFQTILELRLLTGRSHQIRVQLAARGHPIIGDKKYGAPTSIRAGDGGYRIALHARSIEFAHPISKERVEVIAPTHRDWPGPPAPRGASA